MMLSSTRPEGEVELFAPSRLKALYRTEIAPSRLRGLDRLSPTRFEHDLDAAADMITDKVLSGRYRFTPYRQVLRLRGSKRAPRRLAIATARDRLVLRVLKDVLHDAFPHAVNTVVPNRHIREIKAAAPVLVNKGFVKTDIKSFYDCIDHKQLLGILESHIPPSLLRVIERAIRNPILPKGHRQARKLNPLSAGVPQGLAISNILAEISLVSVDADMNQHVASYRRYVDDVLMFVELGDQHAAQEHLEAQLKPLGLQLNRDKTQNGRCGEGFDYLGYHLRLPSVTVKDANIQKQIERIAALITAHTRKADPRYRRLDESDGEQLLINELNDKITGAIGAHRRYGWLFHFSEITDMTLLFRLDRIVGSLWNRIRSTSRPDAVKRFVRTYYEARFNARGGYIHDYAQYKSEQDMRDYLEMRELDPEAQDLPVREVEIRFMRAMRRNFARLEADVGFIS